jgi:hypothetical protein
MVPSGSLAVAAIGTSAGASTDAPSAGLVSATLGGWFSGAAPQVWPLMLNEVGAGLLPLHDPLKPMLVDAPVARLPFHGMLRAVTWAPLWLQVADQPCVTRWEPSGKAKPSSQELMGSPVFVMVTLAVKPPVHWFVA